jgi:hypothetical protein
MLRTIPFTVKLDSTDGFGLWLVEDIDGLIVATFFWEADARAFVTLPILTEELRKSQEENALLSRRLEMLTKQLNEKDERITELTFTIIRANSPA